MQFKWLTLGGYFFVTLTQSHYRWFSKTSFIELMNVSRKETAYGYREVYKI
jgi:hypothetical protein